MTQLYQHCYRALDVESDCTWEELRLAYRRCVRRCHPDLQPAVDGAPARDEELRQAVRAYRRLSQFRRQHGSLPPPWLPIDAKPPPDLQASSMRATGTGSEPRTFRGLQRIHAAVVAAFVSGVCTAALIDRIDDSETRRETVTDPGPLTVGMDARSVVRSHGVPNHTKGSVWFYGESGVIFDEGCVIGWENQPPFPLRTLVSMTYPASRSTRGSGNPAANLATIAAPVAEHATEIRDCTLPGG